jgi:hypothetical protein
MAVVNVTLTLVRCIPGLDDNGNPPLCEDLADYALGLEIDRHTLRRIIPCHLETLRRAYTIMDYGVGAAVSVGPDGGCGGVEITYWFSLSDECCA